LAPQLPAIKWYRPDQISLRGELLGFDRLKAQTGKEVSAL
jgi:hypothetical protein